MNRAKYRRVTRNYPPPLHKLKRMRSIFLRYHAVCRSLKKSLYISPFKFISILRFLISSRNQVIYSIIHYEIQSLYNFYSLPSKLVLIENNVYYRAVMLWLKSVFARIHFAYSSFPFRKIEKISPNISRFFRPAAGQRSIIR